MSERTLTQFALQHKAPVLSFMLALLVTLYLAGKILLDIVHFNDPKHQDQTLRNWMTPQYVMKSYDLPRPIVDDIFELDPEVKKRRKMRFIAEDMNLTLTELTERVRQGAQAYRESK